MLFSEETRQFTERFCRELQEQLLILVFTIITPTEGKNARSLFG